MSAPQSSVQRVQQALAQQGLNFEVLELDSSTRTAVEAAASVGCKVSQIVKSLIFRGKESDQAILVVASGSNRVDEKKLKILLGEAVSKADADFVRARTGFVIGGVAPLGHTQSLPTYIDEDLFQFAEIWAAAGTPRSVFKLTPQALQAMTAGEVVAIKV